jgi:2-dehydropantoate 2-reductase
MKIAVVGAGGIGGYFGAALARAGHEVGLLARGAHAAAIRSRGLEIREPDGRSWIERLEASEDPGDLVPSDLAILSVKSYSVAEVAPAVRRLAVAGAVVVPLLNGVETFETLASLGVPSGAIVPGLAVIGVDKVGPGVVARRSEFRKVVVGEHGGGLSDRAERIAAVFRETGTDSSASADIVLDLWKKFLFLSTIAAACGLARSAVGVTRESPGGRRLIRRLAGETAAVARARGVALPPGEEASVLERIEALAPALQPSFLADLLRGGPTELDVLSGAIVRYAAAVGAEAPLHEAALTAFSAQTGRSAHPTAAARA